MVSIRFNVVARGVWLDTLLSISGWTRAHTFRSRGGGGSSQSIKGGRNSARFEGGAPSTQTQPNTVRRGSLGLQLCGGPTTATTTTADDDEAASTKRCNGRVSVARPNGTRNSPRFSNFQFSWGSRVFCTERTEQRDPWRSKGATPRPCCGCCGRRRS